MLNNVFIVGRLAEAPIKNTVVVAVSRSFKNKEGIYETDFIKCKLCKNIARHALEYLRKGDMVGLKGLIRTKANNNYSIEILVTKLTYLSTHR